MAAPAAAAVAGGGSTVGQWAPVIAAGAGQTSDYISLGFNNIANRREARRARAWSEKMSNTSYQRAAADMKAAGINPIIAFGEAGAAPNGPVADYHMPGNNAETASAAARAFVDNKLAQEQVNLIREQAETQNSQQNLNNALKLKTDADANVSRKQIDTMDAAMMLQYLQGVVHNADAYRIDEVTKAQKYANIKAEKESSLYKGKAGTALTVGEKGLQLLDMLNNIIFGKGRSLNLPGGGSYGK